MDLQIFSLKNPPNIANLQSSGKPAGSPIKGKDLAEQMTLLDSWFYEKLDAIELITQHVQEAWLQRYPNNTLP